MQLSKENLQHITSQAVVKPNNSVFAQPEKVLQFGTGVLLRGLPDYFIDKANRKGVFNGRVVMVKSTDSGDTHSFEQQDGLYTLCIRGVEAGKNIEENVVCAAISRVLSAKQQWHDVLQCAHNPEISILISNTTEVGIQLVQESIFQNPPASFPAKLLAFLYERFKKFGISEAAKLVVLPTELLTDNGKKLQAIVVELAHFNNLEKAFLDWLDATVRFCNTLVDCIVPGKPDAEIQNDLQQQFGYSDDLLTISEVYRLWAIEGDAEIRSILSFAEMDNRVIITPDITKFKELKLRLLNGTHTLSCGLAFLSGIPTVREAMENPAFSGFISHLMLEEIAPAIPVAIPEAEAQTFGKQVLDRFRNPYLQHQWLSISMQYSSKMAQRVIPVLLRYVETFKTIPQYIATGFAAYLLFMKAVKKEADAYWGEYNGRFYPIKDDQAGFYFELWQRGSMQDVVHGALSNKDIWGADLCQIKDFEKIINERLHALTEKGVLETLRAVAGAK